MIKIDKKALLALLSGGLLVIALAGCQAKDELEKNPSAESVEESTEEEISDKTLSTAGKNKDQEEVMIDPSGYNAVEPEDPNLVPDKE